MSESFDKTEAQQDLRRRRNLPVEGGIYRHYKGGLYVAGKVRLLEDLHNFLVEVGVPEEVIKTIPNRPVFLVDYHSNAKGSDSARTLKNFQESVQVRGLADAGGGEITDTVEMVPRFRREGD